MNHIVLRRDVGRVHMVTASRSGAPFGVRCGDRTHVLAFRDRGHAEALGRTLQGYLEHHGHFPSIADGVDETCAELSSVPPAPELGSVRVEATTVSVLLHRVRGARVLVSIMWPVAVGGDDDDIVEAAGVPRHKWHTFHGLNSDLDVAAYLDRVWCDDDDAKSALSLLPKPKPKHLVAAALGVGLSLASDGATSDVAAGVAAGLLADFIAALFLL